MGDNALHCITDRMECCRVADGRASGEWYQPGQTMPVGGSGKIAITNFSRNRNPSAVLLNRRNAATGPTGLYQCDVADSRGANQSLYVGVYGTNEGE